ncbi:MAG: GHKL domain-containing protein [Deltaproteobacteria bacterium]|nr:GHKL domain-containing protein [Deltaproteobacteria bacterium]
MSTIPSDQKQSLPTAPARIPSPRPMSGQLTALSILVAVLPLLCLGTLILAFHDASHREKTIELLSERVLRNAQSLDAFLGEKIANLGQEASAPVEDLARQNYLSDRLHSLQNAYPGVFLGLEFIDAKGKILAQAGQDRSDADYADAPWLPEALGRPFLIGDLDPDQKAGFFATTRITRGRQIWLLRAQLDSRHIETKIRAFHPGGAGGAFILGPRGDARGLPGGASAPPRTTIVSLGQQIFPENRPVVLEAPDATGIRNFYACAPLATIQGILVFHQPQKTLLRRLYIARGVALAVAVAGIAGIVGTIMAMSRRMNERLHKAELLHQQMQQQMIEAGKLAAIGEMAAGVAHEINNPLAIIMENSGWIQDLLKSEDYNSKENMAEIHASLRTIVTQGHRCKEITHRLLSFARKSDNTVRSVQVNALLEDIAGFARQKAKYSGVSIQTKLDPAVPEIHASATEVQQIVLNLVNNAIDAIKQDNGVVRILSRRDGDRVAIDVEDNGEGISPDQRARIFEPFYTTKPMGKGTGLGLAICRDIITNMGGTISVESTPGQGSVFHVHLPVAPED